MTYIGYATVQARGVVALPAELRRRLHLDVPGAQVRIDERDDGVLELTPTVPVPADEAWFWSPDWQKREREVNAHIEAGRVTHADSNEEMLAFVDEIAAKQE